MSKEIRIYTVCLNPNASEFDTGASLHSKVPDLAAAEKAMNVIRSDDTGGSVATFAADEDGNQYRLTADGHLELSKPAEIISDTDTPASSADKSNIAPLDMSELKSVLEAARETISDGLETKHADEPDFNEHDRNLVERLSNVIKALEMQKETKTLSDDGLVLKELRDHWEDAYTAFVGAFNTPVARRKSSSELDHDARTRLKEFNNMIWSSHGNVTSYDDAPAPMAM